MPALATTTLSSVVQAHSPSVLDGTLTSSSQAELSLDFAPVRDTAKRTLVIPRTASQDENDLVEFHFLWRERSQLFYAATTLNEDTVDTVSGTPVPREETYPAWRASITQSPDPLPPHTYIKYAYFLIISKMSSNTDAFAMMNAEIDTLERLSQMQHTNIVEYRGCIRSEDNLMVGICLREYPCTLYELVKGKVSQEKRPPYNPATILADIKAGLEAIHSLGLVHDDINPRNIMLDESGRAVIIDFDSCRPVGEKSRGGTPGWSKDPSVALFENDEYGLDLIDKFMQGVYDGLNKVNPLPAQPSRRIPVLPTLTSFDEDDNRSHLFLWREGSQLFYAESVLPEDTLDTVTGTLVPREKTYPAWRASVKQAQDVLPPGTYVKYPYHLVAIQYSSDGDNDFFQDIINAEIDVLERLSHKPHPNIVEYRGCIRSEDNLMVGICLREYPCSLEQLVEGEVSEEKRPPYNPTTILADIKAGLEVIHGLGLVHDDITPRNIMVDEHGRAIIIDFDTCRPVGAKSRGGTPGWSKRPTTVRLENDEYGLDLIEKYMQGLYTGDDLSAHGL